MIVAARVAVGCMKNLFYHTHLSPPFGLGNVPTIGRADPRASHRADHSNTDSAYPVTLLGREASLRQVATAVLSSASS